MEDTYNAAHPDFVAACEIGRQMARLSAMKLKEFGGGSARRV
jgi:hypothetical protein